MKQKLMPFSSLLLVIYLFVGAANAIENANNTTEPGLLDEITINATPPGLIDPNGTLPENGTSSENGTLPDNATPSGNGTLLDAYAGYYRAGTCCKP